MNAEETRIGKTEAIRVNVDQETKAELKRKAAEQDVSVAHLIRQAIRKFLTLSVLLLALVVTESASADFYIPPAHPRLTDSTYCKPGNWGYFGTAKKSTQPLLCATVRTLHRRTK